MNKTESLKRINKDILEQEALVIDQINKEIEALEQDQLQRFKESLQKDVDTYLERELLECSLIATKKSSQDKLRIKRSIVMLRDQLVSDMFKTIQTSLINKVNSKEYSDYLVRCLQQCSIDDGYFEVRKEDKAIFMKCCKEVGITLDVKEIKLTIGGFNYINVSQSFEQDFTLDTCLVREMQWFRNNSRFTI